MLIKALIVDLDTQGNKKQGLLLRLLNSLPLNDRQGEFRNYKGISSIQSTESVCKKAQQPKAGLGLPPNSSPTVPIIDIQPSVSYLQIYRIM